jgi:hypothetical protein
MLIDRTTSARFRTAVALRYSERALQKRRTHVVLRTLAATLGQLGRIEEARPVLAEMKRIKPPNELQWALISPYADRVSTAYTRPLCPRTDACPISALGQSFA